MNFPLNMEPNYMHTNWFFSVSPAHVCFFFHREGRMTTESVVAHFRECELLRYEVTCLVFDQHFWKQLTLTAPDREVRCPRSRTVFCWWFLTGWKLNVAEDAHPMLSLLPSDYRAFWVFFRFKGMIYFKFTTTRKTQKPRAMITFCFITDQKSVRKSFLLHYVEESRFNTLSLMYFWWRLGQKKKSSFDYPF